MKQIFDNVAESLMAGMRNTTYFYLAIYLETWWAYDLLQRCTLVKLATYCLPIAEFILEATQSWTSFQVEVFVNRIKGESANT